MVHVAQGSKLQRTKSRDKALKPERDLSCHEIATPSRLRSQISSLESEALLGGS